MSEALYRLVIKAGGVVGTTYALETPELYIGRDVQNDIVVPEAEVSRRHARLIRNGDTYLLEDLGSTNGTFVNGRRLVGPILLQPGDEVKLGPNVIFVYERISDPNATVVVQAQTLQAAAQQASRPPQPEAPTPPPPAAAAAPQVSAAASPSPKRGSRMWLYFLILAVILLCLIVAAGLWYIDANQLWCSFFPFLFPGACP